jgi:hypothetical protein
MTPQERELITALFDRLAALESAPRDADAERAIAEGLSRAPHAIYPLVQSVLVQDEALKVANARIEELEAALGEPATGKPQGGFLDTMRDSLLGRREAPHGSVPSVHPGGSPWANSPGYRAEAPAGQPGGSPWANSQGYRAEAPPPSAGMAPAPSGYGGSFLGTAAASAAGMIGGGLLLNGIRSMLGGHQRGAFAGTFDQLGAGHGRDAAAPSGGQGSNDLARQAGLDDIGRSPAAGSGNAEQGRAAGVVGSSDEDGDHHNVDDDGDDHDMDDDSDDGDDSDSDDSDDSSGEPD